TNGGPKAATFPPRPRTQNYANRLYCLFFGHFAQTDQPFLCRRGDQPAVAAVEEAASKAARANRIRAVLRVKHPVVQSVRTMEPHGVVEARHLDGRIKTRA